MANYVNMTFWGRWESNVVVYGVAWVVVKWLSKALCHGTQPLLNLKAFGIMLTNVRQLTTTIMYVYNSNQEFHSTYP